MALHDQERYVAHNFNQYDLINTVVLSTMLLTFHYADASAKSIK